MMMMNEKKRFSDFAETWLKENSSRITKSIITVKRENFLMGLKIDFAQLIKEIPNKNFRQEKFCELFPNFKTRNRF